MSDPTDPGRRVTLTDIDIPFTRLILIFIKFGLAAIPAAIILSIIMGVVMAVLGGIFGGMYGAGMMGGRF
ncbi:hypothetical protein C8N35_1135 [Breoghania corrubedonensis]|uniref:Uncharacterized protein n=1 Tax=Breoghania corrubedonensis TaxID=665038 RepID=A0A2T5UTZ0_9HYPH|nr:hypothetical protein [Breoghania corrubedonensis]PTW54965.1 hypothetical protein C8N35_1135 [Breoghania corrubedonensis]